MLNDDDDKNFFFSRATIILKKTRKILPIISTLFKSDSKNESDLT